MGEKIRELRQKQGLSQEALAEKLQVSRQAVSKWEKGISYPTTENLLMLAELFQVPVELLIREESGQASAALPEEPARTGHRGLWLGLGGLVLAVLVCGVFLYHARSGSPDPEDPAAAHPNEAGAEEMGEFALRWQAGEEWEFLSLGEQETLFPFGRDLVPSAQEQVKETDFGADWTIHDVTCGALHLTYSRIREEEQERDFVDRMATITEDYETPRGIRVGSTAEEVVEQYGSQLLYELAESGEGILCPHEYIYLYAPEESCCQAIRFYISLGSVAGLSLETAGDEGSEAFAVDHQTIFPTQDGKPDFSQRHEPEREAVDETRAVYIALYALEHDENLSEEAKYDHRQTIYHNLPHLDWEEYGLMGEDGKEEETQSELLRWLQEPRPLTEEQITDLLLGACRSNLDGWMAESYDGALAQSFQAYPEVFLRCLSRETFSEEEQRGLVGSTALGGTDSESAAKEMLSAAQSLEGTTMFSEGERENWNLLLEKIREYSSLP